MCLKQDYLYGKNQSIETKSIVMKATERCVPLVKLTMGRKSSNAWDTESKFNQEEKKTRGNFTAKKKLDTRSRFFEFVN